MSFSLSAQRLFRFLILSTKKGRKENHKTEERKSSLSLSINSAANLRISLVSFLVGQHPAGTSDMKSNSF